MKQIINAGYRLFILAVLVAAGSEIRANGLRLSSQDGFASSRGEAFAATADNPSAIYYNPAGITQLQGVNLRVGAYIIDLEPTFQPPAGGGRFHNDSPWHWAPQIYATYSPEDFPLAFGVGVYSPYGLGVKWPDTTGFESIATQGRLNYLAFNPVISWRILTNLSVGAGPTINESSVDLRNTLMRLRGADTAVGFNAGARWEPCSMVALGASFRSNSRLRYQGHRDLIGTTEAESEATLDFPFNVIMGISLRPTPHWNIEYNADYTDWSSVGTINVSQIPVPLVMNLRPSWYHEVGITRSFDNGWRASLGYIFNQSSMTDANYSPFIADVDRHFVTTGFGFQGKHLGFDLAYQLGFSGEHTVSGSALSLAFQNSDGRYRYLSHAIGISMGYKF